MIQTHRLLALAAFLAIASCALGAQVRSTGPAPARPLTSGRPALMIGTPEPKALANGVAIIGFQVAHVRIASLFAKDEPADSTLPAAHLHVTVDGASWHWVHSTSDPVVVAPLAPGAHTVTLELAGADHRPLDSRTARFTVTGKPAPAPGHARHRRDAQAR